MITSPWILWPRPHLLGRKPAWCWIIIQVLAATEGNSINKEYFFAFEPSTKTAFSQPWQNFYPRRLYWGYFFLVFEKAAREIRSLLCPNVFPGFPESWYLFGVSWLKNFVATHFCIFKSAAWFINFYHAAFPLHQIDTDLYIFNASPWSIFLSCLKYFAFKRWEKKQFTVRQHLNRCCKGKDLYLLNKC